MLKKRGSYDMILVLTERIEVSEGPSVRWRKARVMPTNESELDARTRSSIIPSAGSINIVISACLGLVRTSVGRTVYVVTLYDVSCKLEYRIFQHAAQRRDNLGW